MNNRLFQAVDKAPFAGKFSVKESYVNYDTAPDDKRAKQYLKTMGFLGIMVAAHGIQSKMGYDALSTHVTELSENPDAHEAAYAALDTAYMTAMGVVALRQAELMAKVTGKHIKWLRERKKVPEEERTREKRPLVRKAGAVAMATIFTWGAQVAEMQSITDGQAAELSRECSDGLENTLHEFGGGFSFTLESGQSVAIRSPQAAKEYCDSVYEPTSSLLGVAGSIGSSVAEYAGQGIRVAQETIHLG